jgi:hypothetical protein
VVPSAEPMVYANPCARCLKSVEDSNWRSFSATWSSSFNFTKGFLGRSPMILETRVRSDVALGSSDIPTQCGFGRLNSVSHGSSDRFPSWNCGLNCVTLFKHEVLASSMWHMGKLQDNTRLLFTSNSIMPCLSDSLGLEYLNG